MRYEIYRIMGNNKVLLIKTNDYNDIAITDNTVIWDTDFECSILVNTEYNR